MTNEAPKPRADGIDMDALPKDCGSCHEPIAKEAWMPRITPGAVLMGFKITKGLTVKCVKCGNEMFSGILR